VKFDALHQVNVKQSLTAAGVFHICEAIFHIEDISLVPTERISPKKHLQSSAKILLIASTMSKSYIACVL
jgi:hypothetical protein